MAHTLTQAHTHTVALGGLLCLPHLASIELPVCKQSSYTRGSQRQVQGICLVLLPSREARKKKEVLSLGYHGNVVDLW